MDDDELRVQFTHLLTPGTQFRVPGLPEITRRMRRRQLRQATAGLLACAAVVAGAGVLATRGTTAPATGPSGTDLPACRAGALRVAWLAPVIPKGAFAEAPPVTDRLGVRNAGQAACSVRGWPRLAYAGQPLRRVTVRYGTLSTVVVPGTSHFRTRVVRPTAVALRPGQAATATVTVELPPDITGCDEARWTVTLPVPGAEGRTVRHGPRTICDYTEVQVSALYPSGVPLTRNYPASAPVAHPATTINPAPPGEAGPDAAPYFATVEVSKAPAPVVIRAWRTGHVTAVIQPPRGTTGFDGVAGTGDNATYVLAAMTSHGGGYLRFYQLQLRPGGRAAPLAALPVPPVALTGTPFAVSVDGSELALALTRHGLARIMVVSLVSGATRTWTAQVPGSVTGLSWARPRKLAFVFGADSGRPGRSGLRLLDTSAPGSDLLGVPLLIPASVRLGALHGLNYPLISPDGTTLFATMTSRAGGAVRAAVVRFSALTGRPDDVVTPETGESGMGTWCGALWSDPSGSTALAACGIQGKIHNAGFARLDLHFPAYNFSAGEDQFAF